jgi:hypothetical protein
MKTRSGCCCSCILFCNFMHPTVVLCAHQIPEHIHVRSRPGARDPNAGRWHPPKKETHTGRAEAAIATRACFITCACTAIYVPCAWLCVNAGYELIPEPTAGGGGGGDGGGGVEHADAGPSETNEQRRHQGGQGVGGRNSEREPPPPASRPGGRGRGAVMPAWMTNPGG